MTDPLRDDAGYEIWHPLGFVARPEQMARITAELSRFPPLTSFQIYIGGVLQTVGATDQPEGAAK